ncbi:ATP-binding protein [Pseudonocardiaceae bacterium YIM PH 21723]|nr:ATP-binding protein [Pseudonocardiaceae bacterium YIM PH 21723]
MSTTTYTTTPAPDEDPEDNVVQLRPAPPAQPGTEVEPHVFEPDEVLTAEQYEQRMRSRVPAALAGAAGTARTSTTAAALWTARTARRYGPLVGWALYRHGMYVYKGMEAKRQRKDSDREYRDIRAARARALATDDLDKVTQLTDQMRTGAHTRIEITERRLDLAWTVTKRASKAVGVGVPVALVTGAVNSLGGWLGPWDATDVLTTMGAVFTGTADTITWSADHWWLFAGTAGCNWLWRRWRDGRRLGEQALPEKLRRNGTDTVYVELTETALAIALANIGHRKLTAVIKEGWPNRDTDANAWVQPPMMDATGTGWSVKLRLPVGAPVAEVAKAKVALAHNLGCRPQELFIEADENDSTVMELFRLDPGVLREPVPPSVLLEEGATTDFFAGFPVGISPRGQVVLEAHNERNGAVSGLPGSGKTSLVLAALYGAILDPLTDIDVFVFAGNNDYEALKPCLNVVGLGDTAENVQACINHIKTLHADLAVRGELLKKHNIKSVEEGGRAVIAKEPGLRPRILVVDECQAFFRQDSAQKRKELVNLVVRFVSASRKYGYHVKFVTPVPSDQSLPRDLIAITTNKACGAIGDKLRNNVVLGENAHETGVSALGLKPKTKDSLNDVGTLVTVGYMDNPGPVRSYHYTAEQQEQLVQRALELRGGAAAQTVPTVQERDWLADLASVAGGLEKVKLADGAALLRKKAPGYHLYQGLDGKTLAEWLTDLGVPVTRPQGAHTVLTQSIREAIAAQENTTGE